PAHMRDGHGGIEQHRTRERVQMPVTRLTLPVERRCPAALLDDAPALGCPPTPVGIATGRDELEELRVRHDPRREPVRLEQRAMPWSLVVEREATAVVTDPHDAARDVEPLERRRVGA